MKIVVLNAGSGSQRCSLFDLKKTHVVRPFAQPCDPIWEAKLDATAPNQPKGKLRVSVRCGDTEFDSGLIDADLSTAERTGKLLRRLWEGANPPLSAPSEIDAVGHRVVHGGDRFDRAVKIDSRTERAIQTFSAFAPLHNPANLAGVRAARQVCGRQTKQVAVFDTAFHRTLPEAAFVYAGPYDWQKKGIRRYGFHGTNFRWVAGRAAHLLAREGDRSLKLILCHLGGGCSLCATRGGRSLDTTMGFTPLDGIAMSTRSGSLDPGILIYLQRQGVTARQLETMLNRESGLKGLSGISGDTRVLSPRAKAGNARARLALDVFIHRLRAGIGQMLGALGGRPDAIVFTDAIAEGEPALRAAACEPFGFLGLRLDSQRNRSVSADGALTDKSSAVQALLIKSREAWQIASETHELIAPARRGAN